MADLDDFFAKKDRKKSKSVKKFATADEVSKKIDEPKQKNDAKPKKERPVQEGEEGSQDRQEEEEWKEYEEPVKDYTGLKIQVLQGGTGAADSRRDSTSEDSSNEQGKAKGPWNKPSESAETPVAAAVEEVRPREAPVAASAGAYVPPTKRNQVAPQPTRRTQPKNAPDIHNDDYFPVLGGGGGARPGRGGGWSAAARGGAAPGTQAPRALALGNRFTSLNDDS